MIHEVFTRLESLPLIPPTDLLRFASASAQAFEILVDFLRGEALSHPAIHEVMTQIWTLIGSKEIPLLLDPTGGSLPSLHFLVFFHQREQRQITCYLLPYGFLDLVRTDPLMQCCAVLNMASQGCDYAAHCLDPVQTPRRARAYEAELLLVLRPLMQSEGLAWNPNRYLRGVLRQYPLGLESLPADQRARPPFSLRHKS